MGETIWHGISLVASKVLLSVFICVHLWLKKVHSAPQKNPSISIAKICENHSKTPLRQPSSTMNFFRPTGPATEPSKAPTESPGVSSWRWRHG
jgi:hypothetical protein